MILLIFFESLKAFINVVTVSIMPAKLATPGLLKVKVFLNKVYDIIISAYHVTNKLLLLDSYYIIDVVM